MRNIANKALCVHLVLPLYTVTQRNGNNNRAWIWSRPLKTGFISIWRLAQKQNTEFQVLSCILDIWMVLLSLASNCNRFYLFLNRSRYSWGSAARSKLIYDYFKAIKYNKSRVYITAIISAALAVSISLFLLLATIKFVVNYKLKRKNTRK